MRDVINLKSGFVQAADRLPVVCDRAIRSPPDVRLSLSLALFAIAIDNVTYNFDITIPSIVACMCNSLFILLFAIQQMIFILF